MAINNATTEMEYQIVRDGVNKIINIKNRLSGILNDFDTSIKKSLNPDAFVGRAADSVSGGYQTLKSQSGEFIILLQDFADSYSNAANVMEQHEKALETSASTLNQDLERM